MDASSRGHEKVPDGVREGDEAVALEEDHADHVEDAPDCELAHARTLHLECGTDNGIVFLKKKKSISISLTLASMSPVFVSVMLSAILKPR